MNNVWLMRWGLEGHEKDAGRECSQEGFQIYFELRGDKAGGGDERKRRFRVRAEEEMVR